MPLLKYTLLNQRIVEEAQLLAEEKWIIDALKKIKVQKNGLQIERLHLESMREKLYSNTNTTEEPSNIQTTGISTDAEMAEPAANRPQSYTFSYDAANPSSSQLDNDQICNTEELNLSVTNSVFNADPYNTPCDEEEDEEDMENCLIDMGLLMSGK